MKHARHLRPARLLASLSAALCLAASSLAAQENAPLELPMPNGQRMVFRPVFLGIGDKPVAVKSFYMNAGHGNENYKASTTYVELGGAFIAPGPDGKADWMYYIGECEVTRAQYRAFVPAAAAAKGEDDDGEFPQTALSTLEVQAFIEQYNLWLRASANAKLPRRSGDENALGYLRLPTEIEWEFAARGGVAAGQELFEADTPYADELNEHEWSADNTNGKVRKVARLNKESAHPLGLHDMLGNVAELTGGHFQIRYTQGSYGAEVVRGGDYTTKAAELASALRRERPLFTAQNQLQREERVGFRLVLAAPVLGSVANRKKMEEYWPEFVKNTSLQSPGLAMASAKEKVDAEAERMKRQLQQARDKDLETIKKSEEALAQSKADKARMEADKKQTEKEYQQMIERLQRALDAAQRQIAAHAREKNDSQSVITNNQAVVHESNEKMARIGVAFCNSSVIQLAIDSKRLKRNYENMGDSRKSVSEAQAQIKAAADATAREEAQRDLEQYQENLLKDRGREQELLQNIADAKKILTESLELLVQADKATVNKYFEEKMAIFREAGKEHAFPLACIEIARRHYQAYDKTRRLETAKLDAELEAVIGKFLSK